MISPITLGSTFTAPLPRGIPTVSIISQANYTAVVDYCVQAGFAPDSPQCQQQLAMAEYDWQAKEEMSRRIGATVHKVPDARMDFVMMMPQYTIDTLLQYFGNVTI